MNWKTEQRLRTIGPWGIFAITIGAAVFLYQQNNQPGQALAFAEGEEISIGSTDTGRVATISVQGGQSVSAGQIVAMLDTSAIDAEIEVLRAELSARQAGVDSTVIRDTRQRQRDIEKARLSLAREEAALRKSQAELAVLSSERDRLRALVKRNLATIDELGALDLRFVTLERDVEQRPEAIRLLRQQLSRAQSMAMATGKDGTSDVEAALRLEEEVAQRKLKLLEKRRADLMLRAPVAGTVTMVHRQVGEVVTPGTPVVGLVGAQSSRVIACLSENEALQVERGHRAQLQVLGSLTKPLSGHVIALGPLVDEVPLRCRKVPNQPAWGRHVTILLDNQVRLIPGQSLSVEFDLTTEPGVAQAGLSPTPSGTVTAMQVPDTLQALSRFEPSGLIWQPDLARYLVVSDDTGLKTQREHSPWLFSMSATGTVDPNPIPIQRASKIKDLESIAADSDGALYILSSQSYSRKNKRSAARTQFMKIHQEAGVYRNVASQSLAQALDASSDAFKQSLGLSAGTRDLEIEAMTYWQGSLYLGLKAPIDEAGRAMIWKLDDPDTFLQTGNIEDAKLGLWGSLALPAKQDGQDVPAGLSELLFLPNGSLLLTSTPSTGDGKPTGFLSVASQPSGGVMSAITVQAFEGLKPEGLSLSAKPGHIVIAFDKGSDLPDWTELPWPQ